MSFTSVDILCVCYTLDTLSNGGGHILEAVVNRNICMQRVMQQKDIDFSKPAENFSGNALRISIAFFAYISKILSPCR